MNIHEHNALRVLESKRASNRAYKQRLRASNPDKVRNDYRAHRRRRVEFLRQLKLWCGCADCGYREHPDALQFDHLPGTEKLFAFGSSGLISMARLLSELEKCEVVCANCHAVRTAERRS